MTALLQATAEAQSVLKAMTDLNTSLVSLEILEILEHRAFEIWHIVHRVIERQATLAQVFTPDQEVDRRSGARWRATAVRDHSWWEPIQISMSQGEDGQRSLAFSVAHGLARAEMRTISADLDVVELLMRRAIESDVLQGVTASPGRALFELLWPASLKDQSVEERNRRLILDEASAQFPWELLDDRRPWAVDSSLHTADERPQPPVVRFGLVRQLLQTRFQEHIAVPTGKPKALIIANPRGVPMPGFRELPEAEEEAAAIGKLLKETHKVISLVGREATPESICEQLFAEAWEIVHIAAHGVVRKVLAGPDGVQRPMTGVVLGGGIVLGPSVLSKMPVSPSLVFLNCCHLGRVDLDTEDQVRQASLAGQPELAASLAVQLIKNGVRVVVAAGWAVEDTAARVFGEEFYEIMLDGGGFGEAALRGRKKAYEQSSQGTTWGAYQCYGEPDYSFPPACRRKNPAARGKAGSDVGFLVACVQAIAAVEQIRDDINIGLERDLSQQRARLAAIEDEAKRRSWLKSGELRVAFGEARAELGELPQAIEHYEAARSGADSQYKVKAIEQLANLRARCAATRFRNAPPSARDLNATVEEIGTARKLIEDLILLLGATTERLAIVGSCWKRLAQVRAYAGGADDALIQMVSYYEQAAESVPNGLPDRDRAILRSYPQMMSNSARLMVGLRTGQALEAIREDLLALAQVVATADRDDFWQNIAATDTKMMATMATGSVQEEEASILQSYMGAWKHVGSPIKLMSVVEQLNFYEDVLGSGNEASKRTRACLVASVRRMRDALRKAAGLNE